MSARPASWMAAGSEAALGERTPDDLPRFLTVHDLSEYLHINEKKVYALASEGLIPATKITGKWLFPRELVDQWLLQSTHGGVMTDRLILAGSADPLLQHGVDRLSRSLGNRALVSYAPNDARLGLELLARGRIDICSLHWGPAEESRHRHTALLQRYGANRPWLLVRLFQREQGVLLAPRAADRGDNLGELLNARLRWALRADGSGSQRFFQELLARHEASPEQLMVSSTADTDREAAALLAMDLADAAPGSRAMASEYGLGFVSGGWESFDLAMPKDIYFRSLFQSLMEQLRGEGGRQRALNLGGYDLKELGNLVWTA